MPPLEHIFSQFVLETFKHRIGKPVLTHRNHVLAMCIRRGGAEPATSGDYADRGTPCLSSSVRISNAARFFVSSTSDAPERRLVRRSVQLAILLFRQCFVPPGGL
jgi:hypothetical protein